MDVQLNCSALEPVYLSAGLVYSSPDGRITASTLVNRLQIWLLSQNNPSILVNGVSASLSKQCVPQLNSATQSTCTRQLTVAITQETETTDSTINSDPTESSYAISVVGGFLEGLAAGLVITFLLIILIIW